MGPKNNSYHIMDIGHEKKRLGSKTKDDITEKVAGIVAILPKTEFPD